MKYRCPNCGSDQAVVAEGDNGMYFVEDDGTTAFPRERTINIKIRGDEITHSIEDESTTLPIRDAIGKHYAKATAWCGECEYEGPLRKFESR